jgi:hypothetical protein
MLLDDVANKVCFVLSRRKQESVDSAGDGGGGGGGGQGTGEREGRGRRQRQWQRAGRRKRGRGRQRAALGAGQRPQRGRTSQILPSPRCRHAFKPPVS